MAKIDAEIDRLYQLPLAEFTPARNALAKALGRTDPPITSLEKPSLPAWAVNQLYWHHRETYQALISAAERLRAEHRTLLAGKPAAIREAEQRHRDAVRRAAATVRDILDAAGQPASPATITAVQETLEALPAADAPGRLTRPLQPRGFEALEGATIRPAPRPALRLVSKGEPPPQRDLEREQREARQRALEEKRARQLEQQRAREAAAERRRAEQELRRTEAAVERAREAVRKGEEQLERLRQALNEALSAHRRARLRVRE